MKKVIVVALALAIALPVAAFAQDKTAAPAAPAAKEFFVFKDKNARENHFVP